MFSKGKSDEAGNPVGKSAETDNPAGNTEAKKN